MATLSTNAFTPMFDSHVMDICENLRKLAEDESEIIGIQAHDHQHEQIVGKYNDFIASLRDARLADERPTRFQQLVSYISIHFTAENALMQMVKYPDYENHKMQHARFIERLNKSVFDVKEGRGTVEELVLYIGHWLLGHVLLADKEFSDFGASLATLPIH